MEKVPWKPELWKPLSLERPELTAVSHPPRVKSFYDYQDPAETYEVRGILPKSESASRIQN